MLTDPVTGQPLDLRTSDGVTSLYVLDGIGNPTVSIADSGKIAYQVSYDAYGAETVTKGVSSAQWQQNPYGFKTGLRSSSSDTGLTKFGYRWQSATTGQWIERDTLDAPLNPSNANRYAYAGDDPINRYEPTGQFKFIKAASEFGAVTGAGEFAGLGIGAGIGLFTGGPVGALAGLGVGGAIGGVVGVTVGIGVVAHRWVTGAYDGVDE